MKSMTTRKMKTEVLDVKNLAKRWRCSGKTIYRKVKQGLIPHFRIGRVVRFRTDSITLFKKGETEESQDLEINTQSMPESMIQVINDHAATHLRNEKIDPRVIHAIKQVPRHDFVKENAYADNAAPIGYGQTISQPFIVAYMTDLLDLKPSHRVLEIGTGSGYQAAVLSKLANKVYTIERIKELAIKTQKKLKKYSNIKCKTGNGYHGWGKFAPYDRIIVTAAANTVPPNLIDQLKNTGKMILPINKNNGTKLVLYTRTLRLSSKEDESQSQHLEERELMDVRFVPLL